MASRTVDKALGPEALTKGSFWGVKDCLCAEGSVSGQWANSAQVEAVGAAGRGPAELWARE